MKRIEENREKEKRYKNSNIEIPFYYICYYFGISFHARIFRFEQHRCFLSQRFKEIF